MNLSIRLRRRPRANRDLSVIALKCLRKNAAERYESAAALADDLERWLRGEPILARPVSRVERGVKWAQRNPAVVGMLGMTLALIVVAFSSIYYALVQSRDHNQQLSQTLVELQQAESTLNQRAVQLQANSYLSEVSLAHQLAKADDLLGMRAALDRCPPELRNWEWYHLDRLAMPVIEIAKIKSPPADIAYSPNGALLAWVTSDGELTVQNRQTGTRQIQIAAHDGNPDSSPKLAFHPNSTQLVYAEANRLWLVDLKTGKRGPLSDPTQDQSTLLQYVAVCYDPAGHIVAAQLREKPQLAEEKAAFQHELVYTICDFTAKRALASFYAFDRTAGFHVSVSGAAFNLTASQFAAGTVDLGKRQAKENDPAFDAATKEAVYTFRPTISIWDIAAAKLLSRFSVLGGQSGEIRFAPDGKLGVARGRQIDVVGTMENDRPLSYAGNKGSVNAVGFLGNDLVWSGGEDRVVKVLDRATGTERFTVRGFPSNLLRVAISPDGRELVGGVFDAVKDIGAIHRFDIGGRATDSWQFGNADQIAAVLALTADRTQAAFMVADLQGELRSSLTVRDPYAGKEAWKLQTELYSSAACCPDGQLMGVGIRRRPIELIDRTGSPIGTLELGVNLPRLRPVLACAPDGRTAYAAVHLSTRIDDPAKDSVPSVGLFSWNLPSRQRGTTLVAELASALPSLRPADDEIYPTCCGVDPSSHWVAVTLTAAWKTGTEEEKYRGIVVVWDRQSGTEVFRRTIDEPLRTLAWGADGQLTVAGGSQSSGLVIGWDLASGEQTMLLRGHSRSILGLAFGPRDRLVTAGADRAIKIWDTVSKREILTLDGFPREVVQIGFTSNGSNLVAGTGIDWIKAARTPPGELLGPLAEYRIFYGPK